jgi:hypothetical protein
MSPPSEKAEEEISPSGPVPANPDHRHVSLKPIYLRSEGGCNEEIGPSTLRLILSLSDR